MTKHKTHRCLFIVTTALITLLAHLPNKVGAASSDYKIDIVGQPVKSGKAAPFSLRIAKAADGKPAAGTKINDVKLHMVMGKMDMPAPVKFQEEDSTGLYRFNGDLTMYGEWTLDLSVTPQGEPKPIQTSLKFQVAK